MNIQDYLHDFNTKSYDDRIRLSKVFEDWMLETVNFYGVDVDGTLIKTWEKCSLDQDKREKRDIFAKVNGQDKFGQLKYRQPNSGNDIGIELLRPFHTKKEIIEILKAKDYTFLKTKRYGRDFKFAGETYICSDNKLEKLRIIKYAAIKKICMDVFSDWISTGFNLSSDNRVFVPNFNPSIELRYVWDKGSGYGAGYGKLMLYIPFVAIDGASKNVVDMIETPNYVKESLR